MEQQQRDRQARIVASTFANMELAFSQQTHASTARLHAEATAQCERLQQEMNDRDRDAIEVVDFLRTDAGTKAAQIKELELRLSAHEEQRKADESALRRRYEAIISEKEAALRESEAQNERLSLELEAAAQHQIERADMIAETEGLRAKLRATVEHYEQELNRVKFAAVEERVRLQALEASMAAAFRDEVEQRSTAIAKLKQQQTFEDNARLSKDRQILEQEVDALVALSNAYRSRLDEAARGRAVSDDVHAHAVKEAVGLKLRAREADSQRRYAEAERNEASAAMKQTIAEKEAAFAAREAQSAEALAESQRAQRVMAAELARLRKHAATLVANRSTLEQFFHSALGELAAMRRGGSGAIASGSMQPVLAIGSGGGAAEGSSTEDRTFLTNAAIGGDAVVAVPAGVGPSTPRHLQRLLTNEPNAARVRLLTGDRSARRAVVTSSSSGGADTQKAAAHSARAAAAAASGVPPELLGGTGLVDRSPRASSSTAFHQRGLYDGAAAERTLDPKAYYHNHASDARLLSSASRREMMGTVVHGRVGPLQPLGSRTATAAAYLSSQKAEEGGEGVGVGGALLPTVQQFEGMPWGDKEAIVKGMLRFINAAGARSATCASSYDDDDNVEAAARTIMSDVLSGNGEGGDRHGYTFSSSSREGGRASVVGPLAPSAGARPSTAAIPVAYADEGVAWAGEGAALPQKGKRSTGSAGPPRPPTKAGGSASSAASAFQRVPSPSAEEGVATEEGDGAIGTPRPSTGNGNAAQRSAGSSSNTIQHHVFNPQPPPSHHHQRHHQPTVTSARRVGSATSGGSVSAFAMSRSASAASEVRPATRGVPFVAASTTSVPMPPLPSPRRGA